MRAAKPNIPSSDEIELGSMLIILKNNAIKIFFLQFLALLFLGY